jgi:hypothetical protein
VLEVRSEVTGGQALLAIYPNPVSVGAKARLSFVVESHTWARVDVFDALGRVVRSGFNGEVSGGNVQQVSLDVSGLPGGTYYTKLTSAVGTETRALNVIR